MRSDYPAFDVHAHFDRGSPFDVPSGYGGIPDEINRRDPGWIREQYARLGILGGGFSTFASVMEHTECIEEENAGNQEFRTAKKTIREAIDELASLYPEVDDFVREFLPPYGNTLDELLDR